MPAPVTPRNPTAATVREWRISAGLSQAELAARMGVGQSNLSAWETGKNNISVTLLAEVARICQISPAIVGEQILSIADPA